ncbi:MAG: hypothetical protein ACHQSE_02055 [Gemmatimonadales bacterium]
MVTRISIFPLVGVIAAATIAFRHEPRVAASSVPSRRCTMSLYGPEFSRETLVGFGTAVAESLQAPAGTNAARESRSTGRAPTTLAWRFTIGDVPPAVIEPHRAVLTRSLGRVWVIPWFRDSMCALHSSWLGERDLKLPHAVLFLTPRPESLWVNGEPTYDTFDGAFSPHIIWERDTGSAGPMSVDDLHTFLAVYPRLAGFERWREGSLLAWALAHRDSANSHALRPRLQGLMSNRMRDSLNRSPAPLAGIWRGAGVLASGDSIHFWMQLCDAKRDFEWPRPQWGPAPSYSGTARFESIPAPLQYELPVRFAAARDSLSCDVGERPKKMTLPFGSLAATDGTGSWAWLAQFAPDARRAEFYRNDSMTTGALRLIGSVPNLGERTSVNATGDRLSSVIRQLNIRDTLGAATVARWSAQRVP